MNKIIFIHIPRTAGSFVNQYLKKNVLRDFKIFDSWQKKLNRDWFDSELLDFLNYEKCYIHNHYWTENVISQFIKNGWFSFFFVRNPKDILCSRYFYDKKRTENIKFGYKWPEAEKHIADLHLKNLTLNEFLSGPIAEVNWFPKCWRNISYIDQFSEKNFSLFLRKCFKNKYLKSPKINHSSSKGYNYYFHRGDISKKTNEKIENSEFYKEYLEIKKFINQRKKIKLL